MDVFLFVVYYFPKWWKNQNGWKSEKIYIFIYLRVLCLKHPFLLSDRISHLSRIVSMSDHSLCHTHNQTYIQRYTTPWLLSICIYHHIHFLVCRHKTCWYLSKGSLWCHPDMRFVLCHTNFPGLTILGEETRNWHQW